MTPDTDEVCHSTQSAAWQRCARESDDRAEGAARPCAPKTGLMMALMDPVAVLAESSLFRGLARRELEALAPALKSRTFARGSYVFREGDM